MALFFWDGVGFGSDRGYDFNATSAGKSPAKWLIKYTLYRSQSLDIARTRKSHLSRDSLMGKSGKGKGGNERAGNSVGCGCLFKKCLIKFSKTVDMRIGYGV